MLSSPVWQKLTLCFLFAWLAGCSHLPHRQASTLPEGYTPAACTTDIRLHGRFSIQYQQRGAPESLHGKFQWRQQPDVTRINLLSPLSQILAQLVITPNAAFVQIPQKPLKHAPHIDALLMQELGLPLPVSGLQNWLQGCVVNPKGVLLKAGASDAPLITADGWEIRYLAWQPVNDTEVRPKRIDIRRLHNTSTLDDLSIRIVIDSWTSEQP